MTEAPRAWLAADSDDPKELLERSERARERLASVLGLVGTTLEHERYRAAATALATELAMRLGCERVSIGFLRGGRMRVEALSHSAHFDDRTNLIRDLAAAMEEASDQDATIVQPATSSDLPQITRAHEQLAREHGVRDVCTVPMSSGGRLVGAVTFEREPDRPFDAETLRLCEDVVSLAGPILHLKRGPEVPLRDRLAERVRELARKLRDPAHPKLRIAAASCAGALLLLAFAPGAYRIPADATLEGRVQRAIVAGIDGYIAEANARAGDLVREGQVLGSLDDRDLLVEQRRWAGKREQLRKEYFEALAAHDRSRVSIANAKVAQAQAQLELLTQQLGRTRLTAPFDGVVVKGDLSQSLGSPVARGDVLFEVAPLEGYRIILEVDERDIADVSPGSSGRLTLSALPGEPMPLRVERVTPVATAEDGRNFFRVEASLEHPPESLRPGMEGVAKIDAGRRRLFWIWTHDLVDWLRLWAWSWLP